MKLSLLINTFDRPEALAKVLRGVELQTCRPDEILVADDGSGEATRRLVADWRRQTGAPVLHAWQPHEGFRKTLVLNQAIKRSTGDYLVFLDGDCVPHRQFVADHRSLSERGFWVQGRRCFVEERFVSSFEPGQTQVWRWLLTGRIRRCFKGIRLPVPVVRRDHGQRGIIGCNVGVWREDLEAINGFDEAYTGWGGEDSDLGVRLYHLGRTRKFVYGRALVYHLNHPSVPRNHAPENFERLAETRRQGKIRCERGLAEHV